MQQPGWTQMGLSERITPVLREMHWLSLWHQVEFTLTTLTFKTLHGLAPSYLSDACQPVSVWPVATYGHLTRSCVLCLGPRLVWPCLVDGLFAVVRPRVWNLLLASLHLCTKYTLGICWRHICLTKAPVHITLFLGAMYKFSHKYLSHSVHELNRFFRSWVQNQGHKDVFSWRDANQQLVIDSYYSKYM